MRPIIIKTDIPSIFKPNDMRYLKESKREDLFDPLGTSESKVCLARTEREVKALEPPNNQRQSPKSPQGRLRLDDGLSVHMDPNLETSIEDGLMTRHDQVVLKGMSFDEIDQEFQQCAFKDPTPASKRASSLTKDYFIEAMELAKTNGTGPSTNAKEVSSAVQPNQG
ncbi:hypothetical protein FNV43_RR05753 [Rhamnella rubrinervis]|uniref:Uncharacterized protein n=1 Tax=Rhamnella rubrinervis TaxID=2594499 RepID=A0A8K0HMQ1_9ROSA|nr:hypothetical protein FNV43_RR05753 [Rhamnella rubrinervis]